VEDGIGMELCGFSSQGIVITESRSRGGPRDRGNEYIIEIPYSRA